MSEIALETGSTPAPAQAQASEPLWKRGLRVALTGLEHVFLNPIALKELQSALRRLRFLVILTVSLGLLALVIILTVIVMSSSGLTDPAVVGQSLFVAFVVSQFIIATLVFPAFTCTSITEEHVNQSFDLLVTTCMQPWEIVLGKFQASFIYAGTFLVATVPLVALSFLFGGVSPALLVLAYVMLGIYSLSLSIYSLFVSSASTSNTKAIITTYLSCIVVGSIVTGMVTGFLVEMVLERGRDFLSIMAWWAADETPLRERALVLASPIFLVASFFGFFFLAATNRLKPPALNRSTTLRVFFALFLFLGSLLYFGYLFGWHDVPWPGTDPGWVDEKMAMAVSWWAVCAFFLILGAISFASEPVVPSLRVRRSLEGIGRFKARLPFTTRGIRLRNLASLVELLYPGGHRGALFVTVLCGALLLLGIGLLSGPFGIGAIHAPRDFRAGGVALLLSGTWLFIFVFFVGQVALSTSAFLKSPTAGKIITGILLVGLAVVPLITWSIRSVGRRYRYEPPHFTLADFHYVSPVVTGMSLWVNESEPEFRVYVGEAWWTRIEYVSTILYASLGCMLFLVNSAMVRRLTPRKLGEPTAEPDLPGTETSPASTAEDGGDGNLDARQIGDKMENP